MVKDWLILTPDSRATDYVTTANVRSTFSRQFYRTQIPIKR